MAHKKKNNRSQNVLNDKTPFAVTEAYKSARTSLLFTNTEDGCSVIAFTSAAPGEGKTVTCVNMGISLAESGKKVLIIDSDMRKPQVAYTLNLLNTPGLSELLSGVVEIDEEGDCCRQKTEHEGLDVIAAGAIPPNPAELIACKRTAKLFEILTKEYDYILIDTPPCLVVTDALLYKEHLTGYVAVVRANVSRRDAVNNLVERINQIGGRIVGFILNDRSTKTGHYRHYSYGSYEKHTQNYADD